MPNAKRITGGICAFAVAATSLGLGALPASAETSIDEFAGLNISISEEAQQQLDSVNVDLTITEPGTPDITEDFQVDFDVSNAIWNLEDIPEDFIPTSTELLWFADGHVAPADTFPSWWNAGDTTDVDSLEYFAVKGESGSVLDSPRAASWVDDLDNGISWVVERQADADNIPYREELDALLADLGYATRNPSTVFYNTDENLVLRGQVFLYGNVNGLDTAVALTDAFDINVQVDSSVYEETELPPGGWSEWTTDEYGIPTLRQTFNEGSAIYFYDGDTEAPAHRQTREFSVGVESVQGFWENDGITTRMRETVVIPGLLTDTQMPGALGEPTFGGTIEWVYDDATGWGISYTPNLQAVAPEFSYFGEDFFTYEVITEQGFTLEAAGYVEVLQTIFRGTEENLDVRAGTEPTELNLLENDSVAPEPGSLTIVSVRDAYTDEPVAEVNFEVVDDYTVIFTHDVGYIGEVVFDYTYRGVDGMDYITTSYLSVYYDYALGDDTVELVAGESITFDPLTNDADAETITEDGVRVEYFDESKLDVVVNADNTITITAAADAVGETDFGYTWDSNLGLDGGSGLVFVNILPAPEQPVQEDPKPEPKPEPAPEEKKIPVFDSETGGVFEPITATPATRTADTGVNLAGLTLAAMLLVGLGLVVARVRQNG